MHDCIHVYIHTYRHTYIRGETRAGLEIETITFFHRAFLARFWRMAAGITQQHKQICKSECQRISSIACVSPQSDFGFLWKARSPKSTEGKGCLAVIEKIEDRSSSAYCFYEFWDFSEIFSLKGFELSSVFSWVEITQCQHWGRS